MNLLEKTGEKFDLEIYFKSRHHCQELVKKIAAQVAAGMSEKDGQELIKEVFQNEGIQKFWHPSKFRIGSDTIKRFRELPDPNISLTSGELFFIDVGPIIENHEADYGETFIYDSQIVKNSNFISIAEASKKIWKHTAQAWKENHLTGKGLFEFAENYSKMLGYKLNPKMAGHRLGDFPHALFSKEQLFNTDIVPSRNLWVLEIHAINEQYNRGSFFEDILTD